MSTILIIGRHDDPHTNAVTQELERLGRQVECFDSFRGDGAHIRISSSDSPFGSWRALGSLDVAKTQISAVWLRQKPVVPMPWWSPLQQDAARFTQTEWRTVVQTLEIFLPSAFWINSPEAQRRINYKPRQLTLAASIGFAIPDTAVTNDPHVVLAMLERHNKVIYKSFSGYIFMDQTGILTTLVTRESIASGYESIRRAPGIYQQFVEKAFEVRVTVVGKRRFAALIRTPNGGPGAVDWRHAQFENIFEEYDVPADVGACIERFQESAGICYGAYDFVVSPEGKWYFLECNPAGQFLWLELALGHQISRALAEELCRGADSTPAL